MVFSTIQANKIARSALALLKISVGYRLSKSIFPLDANNEKKTNMQTLNLNIEFKVYNISIFN